MDPQGRKWQITINNPKDKNMNHKEIIDRLQSLQSFVYLCLADEVGEKETPHTHIFSMFSSPVRFTTLKNLFPEAHLERARGSAQQNREYIQKSGKWEDSDKAETSVEDSFEEVGELPEEKGQGYRSDIAKVYCQIRDGYSNFEVLEDNPKTARYINSFDKIRQTILEEKYRNEKRDVKVVYIFGATGTGKTSKVFELFSYDAVYRCTEYKNPFDSYMAQSVLVLDEYRESLPLSYLLNILDVYPMQLRARFTNKTACFTRVFIISNWDLKDQYIDAQRYDPETWRALLRRIHQVLEFRYSGIVNHGSAIEYIDSGDSWTDTPVCETLSLDDFSTE